MADEIQTTVRERELAGLVRLGGQYRCASVAMDNQPMIERVGG